MSLEFNAPPSSRRERREREQRLIDSGVSPEKAAEMAAHTGTIQLPSGIGSAATLEPPIPAPEAKTPMAERDSSENSAAEPIAMSRRELRALNEAASATTAPAEVGSWQIPSLPIAPFEAPRPRLDAAPQESPDADLSSVVRQLFTSEPLASSAPTAMPAAVGSETGPIRWTDALTLDVNHDPSDPASMPSLPAYSTDTSTIVLRDLPNVTTRASQTGEIELLVTGTILLPSELASTGALPDLLDSDHVDSNSDVDDEWPLSRLSPKSAATAVNVNAAQPNMVSDPPKARMNVPTILALTAGGAAGVVLIALGVGALFHLF